MVVEAAGADQGAVQLRRIVARCDDENALASFKAVQLFE
jgi:hypothetical protein